MSDRCKTFLEAERLRGHQSQEVNVLPQIETYFGIYIYRPGTPFYVNLVNIKEIAIWVEIPTCSSPIVCRCLSTSFKGGEGRIFTK